MVVVAAQQRQQEEEYQHILHHLAEQQRSMLDQLVTAQAQTSQQLWDWLAQAMRQGVPRRATLRMTLKPSCIYLNALFKMQDGLKRNGHLS